ncbi:MAG: efflux RND transporter permease subunit [Proteobacteria bacterium]|nr:efflux RND transporter permease subunit [Pseudomonadota bacterium]MCP4915723.1 efflux RND transporter permease subunit [Pseudomonadota bacterium]
MRRWLPALAVRRPVTVLMGFLALLVTGVIALADIPLQMMPSGFDPPFMWVWVPYSDSTPLDTDQKIVAPVQEHLSTVPGLKGMDSLAGTGSAEFGLEFHQGMDLDEAYNSVVDRMERAMADLPEDADGYGIWRFDPDDEPIIWAGASIPDEIEDAHPVMIDIVQKRLERAPGVAKVEIWGVDEKVVWIDFDRDALFSHGVNLYELMGTLRTDNFQLASGRINDRGQVRYVRSLARYESLEELARTPVRPGVVLEDIAEIHYRVEPSASIWHLDGKESAGLGITKESTANTVEVAAAVREAFAELEAEPRIQGVAFTTFFDQGELIEESIDNLTKTALQGGLFAVIILFIFLREIRMTLLIAASIPLSLMMTVTVLYFMGGSLNLLSLMGLMIAVGMVVDNAIVVVETIYRRRQAARTPSEAAIDGTAEVNLAITLSTLTTMVVFLPLILMSNDAMFSFFMGALGFPVVFALAASLIVALVFTPLSTVYLKDTAVKPDPAWITWLATRYARGLRWVLSHRFDTAVGVLILLVATVVVPFEAVGCTDQADGAWDDFDIRFEMSPTFGYDDRVDALKAMEDTILEHQDEWHVRVFRTRLRSGNTQGSITVYLDEGIEDEQREDIREVVLAAMPEQAGVRVWSGRGGAGTHGKNIVDIYLEGEDPQVLLALSDEVLRRARTGDGVLSAELGLKEDGTDEIRLNVDRDAVGRYGISASSIGQTLAFAMRGSQLPDFRDGDRDVTVYSRFRYEDRQDLETLLDFPLWSPTTQSQIPLRALTEAEVGKGFGTIYRSEGRTQLPISIEFEEGIEVFDAYGRLGVAMGGLELPRGYEWTSGGRMEDLFENDQARNLALLLSVTFVFLIMGVLFESWLLPMAIITTIPMALFGVYWTLYLTDTPLDVMGGVGLVILVGVVVNNGIVLIDLVTQLRAQGMTRDEALITAGERRLRPILMTAMTTIVGLLPMAVGSSTFVGIPYAPLGRVVAGGIAAATVLTLFFVPFLYATLDELRSFWTRLVGYALHSPSAETS